MSYLSWIWILPDEKQVEANKHPFLFWGSWTLVVCFWIYMMGHLLVKP